MRPAPPPALRRAAALLAAFAAACGDDPAPTPAAVTSVSGASIAGRVGESVPVVVRVVTGDGRPLAGQTVAWSVTAGGGAVSPTSGVSDAVGEARTTWTFGTAPGAQAVTAAVGSVAPLSIVATVSAGRPTALVPRAGDAQRATAGTAVGVAPSVLARDAAGNPVPGVRVTFAAATGGGVVTGGATTTDAAGLATVGGWRLGTAAGPNTLVARVDDGSATAPLATFTALAVAGAAAAVEVAGAREPAGTVGTALAAGDLPTVRVVDANGNPVADATVDFVVASGDAALSGATARTDSLGVAAVGGVTLGTTAGPNVVTASVRGAGSATFTVAARPAAPARVEVLGGNDQRAGASTTLPIAPAVRVTDRYGNAVPGVTVVFAATGGGATVAGAAQLTNAQGVATAGAITLGPAPGTNTVEARVEGVAPATITAVATAGAPATIARAGSVDPVAVPVLGRSAPLTFVVRDAGGFPVPGVTVRFALAPASLGTLSASIVSTDAAGQASVTLHAGAAEGAATVTASVAGLAPVAYTVAIAMGRPASVAVVQGNGQTALFGNPLPVSPAVQVRDSAGNPVGGVPVTFVTFGGSGFVWKQADTTDAQGRADAEAWVIEALGTNRLGVLVEAPNVAGNSIVFTATGVAPSGPVRIAGAVQGNGQSAPRGTEPPTAPGVAVQDAEGRALAGVTVRFTPSGDGVASPETVVTDAQGIARLTSWRLSSFPGVNRLAASVPGTTASWVLTAYGR